MANTNISEITPKILALSELCKKNNDIDPELYNKLEVKRGLRDINGQGVRAGLTEISEVRSSVKDAQGNSVPCEGKLFYRGYNVEDIVRGFIGEKRFGFEETAYLLLFGRAAQRRGAGGVYQSSWPITAPCPPTLCATSL